MLYSDIKRETLSHIMQFTQRGNVIASSYNNQADYLNRIPHLINEAVVHIRTTVKPDPAVYQLSEGAVIGDMVCYDLPSDFWTLRTGGVSVVRDGSFHKTNNYRLQGKKSILIPKAAEGEYMVEYYRYPNQLPMNAKDSDELNEDIEIIQAATYYAAANLVTMEDEFTHTRLYNEYEARLARMTRGVAVEVAPVQDTYDFNVGCY